MRVKITRTMVEIMKVPWTEPILCSASGASNSSELSLSSSSIWSTKAYCSSSSCSRSLARLMIARADFSFFAIYKLFGIRRRFVFLIVLSSRGGRSLKKSSSLFRNASSSLSESSGFGLTNLYDFLNISSFGLITPSQRISHAMSGECTFMSSTVLLTAFASLAA